MANWQFPAWDPVLIDLLGPLDVRWYGLMYIVAFVVGQWVLKRLARTGFFPIPPSKVVDLVFALIFGVVLGGRLGFFIFYETDRFDPIYKVFKIWEGGLSFHGGLLGVVVVFWWFSRRHKLNVLRVADCCALATPPGILAVRMANFINGELFGRITDSSAPLAMKFPTDPDAIRELHLGWTAGLTRVRELAIQFAYDRTDENWRAFTQTVKDSQAVPPMDLERLKPFLDWSKAQENVPLRHPSQLYEGFFEGPVLWAIMLLVLWRMGQRLGAGGYGGIFLMGYGTFRFFIEYYRQPDAQLGLYWDMFSMGQFLCMGMILAGALMFWFRTKGYHSDPVPEPADDG